MIAISLFSLSLAVALSISPSLSRVFFLSVAEYDVLLAGCLLIEFVYERNAVTVNFAAVNGRQQSRLFEVDSFCIACCTHSLVYQTSDSWKARFIDLFIRHVSQSTCVFSSTESACLLNVKRNNKMKLKQLMHSGV